MKRFLSSLILLALSISALAVSARYGRVTLTQPDGTKFYAIFSGDEFMKIKTTETGESIIQDKDGWWSYAVYDAQGCKKSTGCHVGTATSGAVMAQSRNIPYALLSHKAATRRNEAEYRRVMRTPMPRRLNAGSLAAESSSQKNKAGLVILAQFRDRSFRCTRDQFASMLTQKGYSSNGATGSAKEYFEEQFGGLYEFSFDVPDVIVTLSQDMAYYGGNDEASDSDVRPQYMVVEACQLADQYVDFAKYDQDGDGEVDNVFVFFAGLDEASGGSEDCIWSHAWYVKDGAGIDLNLDGVMINRYACSSELKGSNSSNATMNGIGTFCHEYSHTLGLPDFYDTDYNQGGYAAATWRSISLMDGGNYNNSGNTPPYFNAMEREIMNITAPIVITEAGSYELPPINEGVYYRLNTSTNNEYYLIEYRDGKGWDAYMGGSGVLIYHVDKSMENSGYSYLYEQDIPAIYRWYTMLEINALASRQCADVIEADARTDQFTSYSDETYQRLAGSLSGLFFPYGKTNYVNPDSKPGLKCWGKSTIDFAITGIKIENGKATFNVVGYDAEALPVASNIEIETFQDCAILTFDSSYEFDGIAEVSYAVSGEDSKTINVQSYELGHWAVELKGLKPSTSYSAQIAFKQGEYQGDFATKTFMTKKQKSTGLPYIYLASTERNEDGSFPTGTKTPLKVYNAVGAKSIVWSFNGVEIKPDGDCYYRFNSSGTLKAYITWEDESEEVIIKKVRVSDK